MGTEEFEQSPLMRMLLERAHGKVYDQRNLGLTDQEVLKAPGEELHARGKAMDASIKAVKAKGTVEPSGR